MRYESVFRIAEIIGVNHTRCILGCGEQAADGMFIKTDFFPGVVTSRKPFLVFLQEKNKFTVLSNRHPGFFLKKFSAGCQEQKGESRRI